MTDGHYLDDLSAVMTARITSLLYEDDDLPVTPDSIAAAKADQQHQRELVFFATGILICENGQVIDVRIRQ